MTPFLLTKEEQVLTLKKIEDLENLLYKDPEISFSEKIKKVGLEELLPKDINYLSKEKQAEFLFSLKENLKNLPKVTIEIAFDPSVDFILKLKNWFLENLKKSLVLEIKVNPKIVGGARIYYLGKYFDFSLATKIEELQKRNHG
jgi:hypothetical protein